MRGGLSARSAPASATLHVPVASCLLSRGCEPALPSGFCSFLVFYRPSLAVCLRPLGSLVLNRRMERLPNVVLWTIRLKKKNWFKEKWVSRRKVCVDFIANENKKRFIKASCKGFEYIHMNILNCMCVHECMCMSVCVCEIINIISHPATHHPQGLLRKSNCEEMSTMTQQLPQVDTH